LGKELHLCPTCQELSDENHRCMATVWAAEFNKKGIPITKQLVITQQGQGDVRLKEQRIVNREALDANFEAILAERKKVADGDAQTQRLLALKASKEDVE